MANTEIDIQYLDVQIIQAEINNLVDNPLKKGDKFDLKYSTKVNHLYNLEKQLIRVVVELSIIVFVNGREVKAGAKFAIDNYFHYESLTDLAHEENGRVRVESKFAETVKGLAYSTARGIIYTKFSGTFLEGTILPTQMSTDV